MSTLRVSLRVKAWIIQTTMLLWLDGAKLKVAQAVLIILAPGSGILVPGSDVLAPGSNILVPGPDKLVTDGFVQGGKCYDEIGRRIRCFHPPNKLQLALARSQAERRELKISRVVPHPKYNPKRVDHDIALLKLTKKVTCSKKLMLVCITEGEHMDYPKSPVIMAGWGQTDGFRGGRNPYLKQTKLRVKSREKCSISTDTDDVLCTIGSDFGGTPCKGDSGGPLMYVEDGINYITGVVSHGTADCQMTGEVKFSKVTDHLRWIRQYVPLDEVKKYQYDEDYSF
ncbi:chymotrypsin B-like [Uloborus diversus]|uniref:chymotrypsin B-like n=1 Tax=Uloborus diversus TaxID=327109 RepID=UPI00240A1334|nr:chymotrypsin B-like [Uloborus diversus]